MNWIKQHIGFYSLAFAFAAACLGFALWQHLCVESGKYASAGIEVNGVPLAELLPIFLALATGVTTGVTSIVRSVRGPTLGAAKTAELIRELAIRALDEGNLELTKAVSELRGKFAK